MIMKRNIIYLIIMISTLVILPFENDLTAQPPYPPNDHGSNGNQGAGGAAPIDGGSLLLILSGLGYGVVKVIRASNKKNDAN